MAVSARQQVMFWIVGLILLGLFVFWMRGVLLPFVAGFAVAYFLDPLVDLLAARRMPRWAATSVVVVGFFLLVMLALIVVAPLVYGQLVDFSERLPGLLDRLQARIEPLVAWLRERLDDAGSERLRSAAENYMGTAVGWLLKALGKVVDTGAAIVNLLSLLVITPIVAFYLLRDYDAIVAKVDGWLPRDHAETIREQLREVDRTIAGFVRGQGTVCILLGLYYGIGLTLVGLDFGFVIGLITGLLSFIPYFGMLLGFGVGLGVAFAQFGDLLPIGLVAAVFLTGQFLEGNFITPRLVGGSVGLHPVWIIFALLAGGAVFGFVGLLLAVPGAAVIGVLVRFGLTRYLASPYYRGGARPAAAAADPREE